MLVVIAVETVILLVDVGVNLLTRSPYSSPCERFVRITGGMWKGWDKLLE